MLCLDPALVVQSRIFSAETLALPTTVGGLLVSVKYYMNKGDNYHQNKWLLTAGALGGLSIR